MDDLLTTRQVQDLLKVDRITVYRMLQDGRLKGIKIGQQWRFPASEVERFLSRENKAELREAAPDGDSGTIRNFPTHCVQVIQDLYANLGKIGALTVDLEGEPITECSQLSAFCQLVHSTPSGRAACQRSWVELVKNGREGKWNVCHAGLSYQKIAIRSQGEAVAYLISGQVCRPANSEVKRTQHVQQLAQQHGLNAAQLEMAAREIPNCSPQRQAEMVNWPVLFQQAVESILAERAGLVGKLRQIAALTQME